MGHTVYSSAPYSVTVPAVAVAVDPNYLLVFEP